MNLEDGVSRVLGVQLHVTDLLHLDEDVRSVANGYNSIKPTGGLWTSTYNNEYGSDWIQWCESEEFSTTKGHDGFLLYPDHEAKIFTIDDLDDLINLFNDYELNNQETYSKALNFERISQEYDAIHLSENGQRETRLSYPYNLCGWDCECTLWFRWCFKEVEKFIYKGACVK